jgi:sugar phosphate isomerase/epimerase
MAVDLNVDGIDMTVYWVPTEAPEWYADLRKLSYRANVHIYSIAVRTELTKATQADRDKEVTSLNKWIDLASVIGATHLRVFGGNVPKGATEELAVPWVVECLKRSGDYAGKKGIILGMENHGGICTRADRMIEMIQKVGSPWVGMNLDTGNFRTEAFKQMEMCLPYAVNVQLKSEMTFDDGTRGPQDWDRVVKLIAGGGYKGYIAIEYEAKEPAPTAMPRLLGQLNTLCRKYSG